MKKIFLIATFFVFVTMIHTPKLYPQQICEGEWSGMTGLFENFSVPDQNTIQFVSIGFRSCAVVFADVPDAAISNRTFSLNFNFPSYMSGRISGTFSQDGKFMTGTFNINILLCGETRSGNWTAVPTGRCSDSELTADFICSPTSGSTPLTVLFTDLSIGRRITNRLWDFGDGETSTERNPSHIYPNPGNYTVQLTTTGPGGSDTETKQNFITVDGDTSNLASPRNLSAQASGCSIELSWRSPDDSRKIVQEKEPNAFPYQGDDLRFGDIGRGTINPSGDEDFWKFDGSNGQQIIIDIDAEVNGSVLDARVGLYVDQDDDGFAELIGVNDDFLGSLDSRLQITLPASSTYYIFMVDFNDSGGPGFSYDVKLISTTSSQSSESLRMTNIEFQNDLQEGFKPLKQKLPSVLRVGTKKIKQAPISQIEFATDQPSTLQPALLSYNIYRSTFSPVTMADSNRTASINSTVTTFIDTNVLSGNTYYYVVTAVYEEGESKPSGEASVTIPELSPPALVSPIDNTINVSANPTFTWAASNCATSYQVNVSESSNFDVNVVDVSNILQMSYMARGLGASTSYFWRVRAMTSSDTSVWATIRKFTTGTPPLPPIPSVPANGAINVSTNPTFTWVAVGNVDAYHLQVADTADLDSMIIDLAGLRNRFYQVQGLKTNTVYYWRVSSTNSFGTGDWSPQYRFTTSSTVSVESLGDQIPQEFQLMQNYPNPFNPETAIAYHLPDAEHVRLLIYNIRGQEVATLVDEYHFPGVYSVRWDGKDGVGRNLASGIYFYRLLAGNFVQTRKLLIVR